MRQFSPELQSHLASGATSLCTGWIVKRNDDIDLGFTDHDYPILIDDIECQASSGFQPTQAVSDLGLAADNQEIEGAISSHAISEIDLKAGRFDGALVDIWMVNWAAPEERHLMRTAILGELSREDHLFKAELRGLTSLLDQRYGRTYKRTCDATVGDERCGIDLEALQFNTSGEVTAVSGRLSLRCTGLSSHLKDWFIFGKITWTSGENAGLSVEISGSASTRSDQLNLWKAMPFAPRVGDQFTLTAGCDKTFQTCKSKFANSVNFRGCPHIPGPDFALGYADRETLHDGSVLVP